MMQTNRKIILLLQCLLQRPWDIELYLPTMVDLFVWQDNQHKNDITHQFKLSELYKVYGVHQVKSNNVANIGLVHTVAH